MTLEPRDQTAYVGWRVSDEAVEAPPPPGQMGVVLAGLAIGIILMGIQLWLLTVALELYLAGEGQQVWLLALISGAIFLGGLLMLWLLRRRPHMHRTSPGTSELPGPP